MNSSPPAIEIAGLTKRFGTTNAVDGLDLTVPRGTTLGLLGPNGAGKSTTLKMLLGMLRPTGGSVHVLGTDVFRHPSEVKQRVGYVSEAHLIYRWMKVREVVRFARGLYTSWNDERCNALLDMFQLPAEKRVRSLSKGMLAKLSLVVALAHEPELLVLDEPLSGLDPIARDDFLDGALAGLTGDDHTVIFSSHQLDEVHRLADTVAIMNDGRLLVHCPVQELLDTAKRIRAVLDDGRLPEKPPPGTIWQHVNRREWLVTIHPFSHEAVERMQADNAVSAVDVLDLGLDDIFKDFIRGRKQPC